MNTDNPAERIAQARTLFPGATGKIYLETSARGLLPKKALDAAMHFYEAAVRGDAKENGGVYLAAERVREKFARLVGAAANEVTYTRNVSEGLNMIVASLPWQHGDNAIVCRDIEHPNGVYSLYNMRDRHGIEVRMVDPTPDLAMPVDEIAARIDGRTRLVMMSSVTFATGARTELARMGQICRERGVTLLVDGAQSVGALDIDVHAAHVDAMAVGASKYLCGPYGLGFLFVRRALAETLRPAYLGRFSIDLGNAHEGVQGSDQYRLMPGAQRFDLGSANYPASNAIDASLDILQSVGVPVIEHHVTQLARRLDAGLRALGLPLISGSVEQHCAHIVVAGWKNPPADGARLIADLSGHFADRHIRVSERLGRLRFSFHLYNTADEVDTVLDAVRQWPRLRELATLRA
jgi:cysteine desulfurase/selenocysteine lyase